jgi:aspartyl protease family protein
MPAFVIPSGHLPVFVAVFALALLLLALRRLPLIGRAVQAVMLLGALALLALIVSQRVDFDPTFARIADFLNAGSAQQVVGKEMRVPMARDGHFWVTATIGHTRQRMLVDSGATITALSARTAAAAGIRPEPAIFPMLIRTANGTVPAATAKAREFRIGNIVARDLPVVVSPAFGDMNVVGMNFLSRLKGWRVEGGTMILTPHHPQAVAG